MSMPKSKKEIQRDYELRTGYAAQKKYDAEKVVKILLRLNKDTDIDIISSLNDSEPLATQVKKMLRSAIQKQEKKSKNFLKKVLTYYTMCGIIISSNEERRLPNGKR